MRIRMNGEIEADARRKYAQLIDVIAKEEGIYWIDANFSTLNIRSLNWPVFSSSLCTGTELLIRILALQD